jgi:hypothetical protein
MYKLTKPSFNQTEPTGIYRIVDNLWIPINPDNTDYQQYLKWIAEGNTPEPADSE